MVFQSTYNRLLTAFADLSKELNNEKATSGDLRREIKSLTIEKSALEHENRELARNCEVMQQQNNTLRDRLLQGTPQMSIEEWADQANA